MELDGKTTLNQSINFFTSMNISEVTRLNWILEKLEDVICNLIKEQIIYKWAPDSRNCHNCRW